ncbi:MAG: chromosome segregation protein SMC [bacterium]|nr:chromosome segregation protein SMC [Candidatus Sumerlaeota bacterium]
MLFFKRLELQGFKTFTNKTAIDFFPGITIIVGPNGCGKSNIFDSIRWVLGEQSAKSMRGSRMGDVIFNGSAGEKAMGMARVNLVLDNGTRSLPIDFDEVSISRRLYRTGESEYLLNKANCRLRDITNLLLDTGIGTDSYSVMEQGRVDAIINSKPLERRALFDEAAGIAKYKTRREEALRKLEKTDADFLRLSDIIAEVRRQANSLKRQASKAERYKRLTDELRNLEMQLLAHRLLALKKVSAQTDVLYESQSAKTAELRRQLSEIDEQQSNNRTAADESQKSLETTQSISFQISANLQDTLNKITLFEERIAGHDSRRETIAAGIAELGIEGRAQETAESEIANQASSFEQNLNSLREDYISKKSQYDSLKREADDALARIASIRREAADTSDRRSSLDNDAGIASAMEAKLVQEMAQSDSEVALLEQQIGLLAAQKNEQQSTSEENEQLLATLKTDLDLTANDLKTHEQENAAISGRLETARSVRLDCQSRHDALAELQANFDGYYRGVREVMLAAKSGAVSGLAGVVSALIEAHKEHELAIEIALGGHAQDIITGTAEDAKAAIVWLKQTNSGRATFLPLDLVEARETPAALRSVLSTPGVIGLAAELVTFDPGIRNIVQHLLGHIVVCENLDVAVALERRGFRAQYVTLDGDLLTSSGAMSGGSVRSAGLLNRTRQVKELAGKLLHLKHEEAELSARAADIRAQIDALREKHAKLRQSVNLQEIEEARTRKDYEVLEGKHAEKSLQLNEICSRRGRMKTEIESHRQTREKSVAALAELSTALAQLERNIRDAEALAAAKQKEHAESGAELNEMAITLSAGSEKLASMRDKQDTVRRERARITIAQTEKQSEAEKLKTQTEEAASEIGQLREKLNELQQRQDEASNQLTIETSRRETIQFDLRKLGEQSHIIQRDLNDATNQLHEVELKRAEFAAQKRNFEMQSQEKFNQTLDDLMAQMRANLLPDGATHEPSDRPRDEAARAQTGAPVAPPLSDALPAADDIAVRINEIRTAIDNLGPVHAGAIDEYNDLNSRYEFMSKQERDLIAAKTQLTETIHKIDETTEELFTKSFAEIREHFLHLFRRLFGGGRADIVLTEENGVLNSGIDIIAQPPGKKPEHISLLSGGETALTAIALLFAVFMWKPSPFCILDEIDAPLDDTNIERFKELLSEFSHSTQFIIITHNKQTMTLANMLYGITMEEQGVSRVVSLRLDEYNNSDLSREIALA